MTLPEGCDFEPKTVTEAHLQQEMRKLLKEGREKCAIDVEQFALDYADRRGGIQVESIKAEAWAIMLAAEHLRSGLKA